MTFIDESLSHYWEPGGDSPVGRMKALSYAKKLNLETWVSLEPVIDPDESLRIIGETHEFVDTYKIGTLNYNKSVAKGIDWIKFASQAVDLLEKLGKQYYLKKDLQKFLSSSVAA